MKYLNKILITLVGLLLLFVVDASAEVGGDLNLQNKASLSSRTGYNLNLSTQGSSDSINFIINGTSKGTIGSSGFSGLTLASPTISGNLTFSTAAAKIIPGATSLTFRNNADSADNLSITDAGIFTFRNRILFNQATAAYIMQSTADGADNSGLEFNGGGTNANTQGAGLRIWGNEKAGNAGIAQLYTGNVAGADAFIDATDDIFFRSAGTNTIWSMTDAGALTQDATNGGNIKLSKASTYIDSVSSGGYRAFGGNTPDADVASTSNWIGINNSTTTGGNLYNYAFGANTSGATIVLAKTRSTSATGDANTVVQTSDILGRIEFQGADGTAYRGGAVLQAVATGPGSNDMDANLEFLTSANGGVTPIRRWYVTGTGVLTEDSSNGGGIAMSSGTFTSSRTTDLGWTPVDATDNQACNTGCTSACVFGFNVTAGNVTGLPLACNDATADVCVCAGAS